MTTEHDYPSLQKQLNNFKTSFAHVILSLGNKHYRKVLKVPGSLFEERLSICKECDRYVEEHHRCGECGCFIGIKARVGIESCPLKKWSAIEEGQSS